MCHTRISLDPEADARFSAVFDAAVAAEQAKPEEGRTFDQLKADAFMNLVTAPAAPGARRPAEISVLIDLATLQHGLHETSVCETFDGQPLPPATVRRLACEAEIIPIVLGGDGSRRRRRTSQTLGHRRPTKSTASDALDLRRAGLPGPLRRLRHPPPQGMGQGGATDLANLIPLCSKHHHLIHEGQWRPPAESTGGLTRPASSGRRRDQNPATAASPPRFKSSASQLVRDQLVAVEDQLADPLVRDVATDGDGDPVALVEVISGDDRLVLRPQHLADVGVALHADVDRVGVAAGEREHLPSRRLEDRDVGAERERLGRAVQRQAVGVQLVPDHLPSVAVAGRYRARSRRW